MKAPLVKHRISFAFVLLMLFLRRTISQAWRRRLRRERFCSEHEKRMLFIVANYPQRGRRSRPRVLCAFIEAKRRALTAAAAEGTRRKSREASSWLRVLFSLPGGSCRPDRSLQTASSRSHIFAVRSGMSILDRVPHSPRGLRTDQTCLAFTRTWTKLSVSRQCAAAVRGRLVFSAAPSKKLRPGDERQQRRRVRGLCLDRAADRAGRCGFGDGP